MKLKNPPSILQQRTSGLLLSISSLPGAYGIGDLGPTAFRFIDFLHRAGQTYWQILPVAPTSPIFFNSPYMSFSAFAGNPLLISPELLVEDELLLAEEINTVDFPEYHVDFNRVTSWKHRLLRLAWQRFQANGTHTALEDFRRKHPWVDDHAVFIALKKAYKLKPWYQWPQEVRFRHKDALTKAQTDLATDIEFALFEQYIFFKQWESLHSYSKKQCINLIGDLPLYVGLDSVDVWANQEIFDLDSKSGRPKTVAGVPPDYFSATGQLWGNPLYRWGTRSSHVKEQLYGWWQQRLAMIFKQVDVIRIDHFRGFESYWSVPAREKTAINGIWKKGPGLPFFQDMEKRLGRLPIIAEDLGIITPAVEQLRDETGYPGMKILLFAFDEQPANSYLPHNLDSNCVIYTGTHDNDTAVGWFLRPDVSDAQRRQAKHQANCCDTEASTFHKDMIYLALSSIAQLAIIPMQDLLGFGNDCRMNTPGTTTENWQWRCAQRFITNELADWFRNEVSLFNRINPSFLEDKTTAPQQVADTP